VIFAIAILAILVFVKPQMEIEEGSLGIKNENSFIKGVCNANKA
jgi:hypothetical protein